jgi:hypothetical protein
VQVYQTQPLFLFAVEERAKATEKSGEVAKFGASDFFVVTFCPL